jgi:hypothetical protein
MVFLIRYRHLNGSNNASHYLVVTLIKLDFFFADPVLSYASSASSPPFTGKDEKSRQRDTITLANFVRSGNPQVSSSIDTSSSEEWVPVSGNSEGEATADPR